MVFFYVFAVSVFLFLFLSFPSFRRHEDLKLLDGALIAHRGLHNALKGIPENSIEAFRRAVQNGYMIEIDIHLTKDNKVVVFHDESLERMCGVKCIIEKKTLAELKELRLNGTQYTIPTLEECLETVNGQTPILIEFKVNRNSKELFFAAESILKNYKGKYFIQSFFPSICRLYKKYRKDICRGQLSTPFYNDAFYKKILGALLCNFLSRPDFVSYEYKYSSNIFFKINKSLGAFPVCWTVKSRAELNKSRKNFKTFIFENFNP